MGRGGYLGGSTIIYPGSDWFSGVTKRDPSPNKARKRRTTTNNCTPEGMAFLKAVIETERARKPAPAIPAAMSDELAAEIKRAGGPLDWAKSRKEYKRSKQALAARQLRGKGSERAASEPESPKLSAEARKPEIRRSYVAGILAAERKGRPLPDRPRVLRVELEEIGSDRAQVVAWARQQPDAREHLAKESLEAARAVPEDRVRVDYLTIVVGAIMRKQALPRVPKNASKDLLASLSQGSDLRAWARQQPEYTAVATKVLARLNKAGAPQASSRAVSTAPLRKAVSVQKSISSDEALQLKHRILKDLESAHPISTIASIIEGEQSAWRALQADASRRLGVSANVDIRKFPIYLTIYEDIRHRLRARRLKA